MNTQILYPPLYPYFFNCLLEAKEDVLLTAPYIKAPLAHKIVRVLEASGSIKDIRLTLITNVDTGVLLSQASDVEAIDILLTSIPNVTVIGIGNLHAKCYIFDFKTSIITSGNLSPRGMSTNLELGVLIEDEIISRQLHNDLVLKYGNSGTQVKSEDIEQIKSSIEKYISENKELIVKQSENLNESLTGIEKYVSNRVPLKTNEIISPEITAIISSKERVSSYAPASLPKGRLKIEKTSKDSSNSSIDAEWLAYFNVLKLYREVNPQFWPLLSEEFNNEKIGLWCATQRLAFSRDTLSHERVKLLDDLGFIFKYEDFIWNHRYNLLLNYRDEYPNQWPVVGEAYQGNALGNWCVEQGKLQRKLTRAQHEALSEIAFPFSSYASYKKIITREKGNWDSMFQRLVAFYSVHNRYPAADDSLNGHELKELYAWAREQKNLYNNKQLNASRRVALEAQGFVGPNRLK